MWSTVAPHDVDCPAPSARSKHSATLIGHHVYLLGGRNGNLPLKDFWKYNLVNGKWEQLKPTGDILPALQEHSAVVHKDCIYIFGGEVGFSAGTETPLWIYDIKNDNLRKVRAQKGTSNPKGRRGHTSLVYKGSMYVYGGYQDLRGSCSELWAFHFDTSSWHLVSNAHKTNTDVCPPARHKHSAILHNDAMWIYGGMTDLQERSDLWKWDMVSRTWNTIKTKLNPGPLHSHAACRLPSSMIIFGGERDGHQTNDLWKFSFTMELWEKIIISGLKPQPRAETVALSVSQLILKENMFNSLEAGAARTRARTCNSADRGNRHSSYLPNNRVKPCEKMYVFKPSHINYIDGSELAQQYSEEHSQNNKGSFLQEISKLSNLNISRLNNKCSYTFLTGCTTDSTESLLRQYSSPPGAEAEVEECGDVTSPSRGIVKSKSAYVIKKRDVKENFPVSPETDKPVQKPQKHVEFASGTKKIPREPLSVPNFSLMTLPTPVLTPVEAARLVFLDSEDEADSDEVFIPPIINNVAQVKPSNSAKDFTIYENFKVVKRGESYSSHLAYADNPLYQHIINAKKFQQPQVAEVSNETISSTSDYASIETVNRLSSASNYSVKITPQDDVHTKDSEEEGPFGFCNPNYFGPDIKSVDKEDTMVKKSVFKLLNTPDSVLEDSSNSTYNRPKEDTLELQNYNGTIDKNTKVLFRNNSRNAPPKSLPLARGCNRPKCRARSASRVEKNCRSNVQTELQVESTPPVDDYIPLYIYVVGGKEHGQVTVFKRPLSIWKLKLF